MGGTESSRLHDRTRRRSERRRVRLEHRDASESGAQRRPVLTSKKNKLSATVIESPATATFPRGMETPTRRHATQDPTNRRRLPRSTCSLQPGGRRLERRRGGGDEVRDRQVLRPLGAAMPGVRHRQGLTLALFRAQLEVLRDTSLTLELNLSTFGTRSRYIWGTK